MTRLVTRLISRKHCLLVLGGIALLLAACAPPLTQPDNLVPIPSATITATLTAPPPTHQTTPLPLQATPSPVPTEVETMPPPDSEPIPYDPAMQPVVQVAIDDLSARLGIPADQIQVLEAESVVWGDTSMGCPQPGMAYLQVPQDGARIRLSAGGKEYNYHSGGNRPPFLCTAPEQGEGKSTPFLGKDILTPPSPGDE